MKWLRTLVALLVTLLNLMVAVALIGSAYSAMLHPASHPVLSVCGLAFPVFAVAELCLLVVLLITRQYRQATLPFLAFVLTFGELRAYCPVNLFAQQATGDTLRVLTYNVMSYAPSDETNTQAILDFIVHSGADIVCLQEHNLPTYKRSKRRKDIEQALAAYPYHQSSSVGQSSSNNVAIYSRLPILSAKAIDGGGDHHGSAIYELLWNADTITVINNHLESNKLTDEDKAAYKDMILEPERAKVESGLRTLVGKLAEASAIRSGQVDALLTEIDQRRGKPMIVCGDFNDSPVSYARRTLARRLDDAYERAGNGPGISYNRNGFYFRIDHMLTSPHFRALDCHVDPSIKASDHYPLLAVFVMDGGSAQNP